jgi:hypothetical protein
LRNAEAGSITLCENEYCALLHALRGLLWKGAYRFESSNRQGNLVAPLTLLALGFSMLGAKISRKLFLALAFEVRFDRSRT